MSTVVAICGAFLLGIMAGGAILGACYALIMKHGLHAFLHGIAKKDPLGYSFCCPRCEEQTQELLGSDYRRPAVEGCIHCKQ